MNVTVRIPSGMRNNTNGQSEIAVSGGTIADVIADLEQTCPGIKDLLCNEDGALHKFVMLALDGIDVKTLDGLETTVPPGANIDIVRAFAGG